MRATKAHGLKYESTALL